MPWKDYRDIEAASSFYLFTCPNFFRQSAKKVGKVDASRRKNIQVNHFARPAVPYFQAE